MAVIFPILCMLATLCNDTISMGSGGNTGAISGLRSLAIAAASAPVASEGQANFCHDGKVLPGQRLLKIILMNSRHRQFIDNEPSV